MAPSTYSLGSKVYHGAITKQDSKYLRWVLNQSARAHIKTELDGTVAGFHSRLKSKKGNVKAVVAASAKLLKVVYLVLRETRPYLHDQRV